LDPSIIHDHAAEAYLFPLVDTGLIRFPPPARCLSRERSPRMVHRRVPQAVAEAMNSLTPGAACNERDPQGELGQSIPSGAGLHTPPVNVEGYQERGKRKPPGHIGVPGAFRRVAHSAGGDGVCAGGRRPGPGSAPVGGVPGGQRY